MGDPTKVLIQAPTTYTQFFGRTVCSATANGLAGLAAIQALYESKDGPITASSSNDGQISYVFPIYYTVQMVDGRSISIPKERDSSQSTSDRVVPAR